MFHDMLRGRKNSGNFPDSSGMTALPRANGELFSVGEELELLEGITVLLRKVVKNRLCGPPISIDLNAIRRLLFLLNLQKINMEVR